MFRGKEPQGFTIIEIMIFLAVTALIAASVIFSLDKQINKTSLNQSAFQLQNEIQSLVNNIENGYYANYGNFSCTGPSSPTLYPIISLTPAAQGQNFGCAYIGHVLQFFPTGITSPGNVNVVRTNNATIVDYTIVGRQYTNSNIFPTSLTESLPRAIGTYLNPAFDTQVITLPGDLQIKDVSFVNPGNAQQYDSLVGLFSAYGQGTGNAQVTGSTPYDLVPIPINTANGPFQANSEFVMESTAVCDIALARNDPNINGNTVNSVSSATVDGQNCSDGGHNTTINPPSGVQICLETSFVDRHYVIITIGGNTDTSQTNPLTVHLNFSYQPSGNCPF